jgi:hypothetical protein
MITAQAPRGADPACQNNLQTPTSKPEALKFHVPEPAVRPGGTPDFSNVTVPQAGAVPRPPIDADPGESTSIELASRCASRS